MALTVLHVLGSLDSGQQICSPKSSEMEENHEGKLLSSEERTT